MSNFALKGDNPGMPEDMNKMSVPAKIICVIMSNRREFNKWAEEKNLRINKITGRATDIDSGDVYCHCITKDQMHGMIFHVILMPENDFYSFALTRMRK